MKSHIYIFNENMKSHVYTFNDGSVYTSKLETGEFIKRLRRLDTLRVLVEQHECKEGESIYKKAFRAYNKTNNFTGIIRLTFLEKDWLAYMLENEFNSEEDIEVIKFYTKITEQAAG